MGKSSINGPFSMAMLNNQRVSTNKSPLIPGTYSIPRVSASIFVSLRRKKPSPIILHVFQGLSHVHVYKLGAPSYVEVGYIYIYISYQLKSNIS